MPVEDSGGVSDDQLRIIIDALGADKVINDFKKIEIGMTGLNRTYEQIGLNTQNAKDQLVAFAREKKRVDDLHESLKAFRMEFLGIMFAGMALQRTFGKLFDDMLKTYKDLTNASNPLKMALVGVEAQFTFLKYSIIEAMSGPIMTFTDLMVDFVEFLTSQDPEVLEKIGLAIIGIATAGGAMFVAGQGALAANSIMAFLVNMKDGTYGRSIQKFVSGDMSRFVQGMKLALAAGLAIDLAIKMSDDTEKTVGEALMNALQGLVVAGLLTKSTKAKLAAFSIVLGIQIAGQKTLIADIIDAIGKVALGASGVIFGLIKSALATLAEGWKRIFTANPMSAEETMSFFTSDFRDTVATFGQGSDELSKLIDRNIRQPLLQTTPEVDALSSSMGLFSTETIQASLVPNFMTLNGAMLYTNGQLKEAKVITPELTSSSAKYSSQLKEQAAAADAAARAQERLNKAMRDKQDDNGSGSPRNFTPASRSYTNVTSVKNTVR